LPSQEKRYLMHGFTESTSIDLNTVWENIPVEEQKRVVKLELLDELEELNLIQAHYCITHSKK
jgi:hypothetical protein